MPPAARQRSLDLAALSPKTRTSRRTLTRLYFEEPEAPGGYVEATTAGGQVLLLQLLR